MWNFIEAIECGVFKIIINQQTWGMTLEILTPEKKIFSGDVYGVQLPGISGLFEVLDKHAPMVSALKEGKLKILKEKNTTVTYTIQSGFAEILNNKTTVLVEGAEEV
jgi:F-type H+-transporting ATPase subunit epsilon